MPNALVDTLNADQRRTVENVRAAVQRIWKVPLHRYYTDHTVAHSERVIALLAQRGLTAGVMATDKRLSPTEILILLAAAYLHDIGMQDERFAGGDLDAIRAVHNQVTAELIYRAAEDPAQAVHLGLPQDPGLVEAVALVAKGHRKVDLHDAEYDSLVHGGETLRLRFLAALLRFGDELDIDHRRVDLELMKVMNLPVDSQLHWWKCHYVSGVGIEDEYIQVTYRFPQDRPDYENLIVPLVEGEIRAKHAALEPIFRTNAVKVALAPSRVRAMRLVQPLPAEVEALARELVAAGKLTTPPLAPPPPARRPTGTPASTQPATPTPSMTVSIVDQRQQQVTGTQINVAGSYVDQRTMPGAPGEAASTRPASGGRTPAPQPARPSAPRQPVPVRPIQDAIDRRALALFVGADLPQEVTGLPSRADLARALAQRHGLDETLSLAEVAQRVSQAGNRYEFTSFLRDHLDTTGQSPQPFHHRLVQVIQAHQVETLITTAYDNLLELAFQEAGVGINRVVRDSDLAFVRRDRPTLVKLYGDAHQVDTLVVTADDHYGLWRDRDKENLLAEVCRTLSQNVVLFLGYNLSDPDFNLLWREVLDRAGRFVLGAYAVWPGLPEADVRMWRDRGITILDADPLEGLDEIAAPASPPSPPDETIAGPTRPRLTWDIAVLRQLLNDAFDDPELDAFCLEQAPEVYDKFSRGMRKDEKITLLLDYGRRRTARRPKLLVALEKRMR